MKAAAPVDFKVGLTHGGAAGAHGRLAKCHRPIPVPVPCLYKAVPVPAWPLPLLFIWQQVVVGHSRHRLEGKGGMGGWVSG